MTQPWRPYSDFELMENVLDSCKVRFDERLIDQCKARLKVIELSSKKGAAFRSRQEKLLYEVLFDLVLHKEPWARELHAKIERGIREMNEPDWAEIQAASQMKAEAEARAKKRMRGRPTIVKREPPPKATPEGDNS